jgi:hypothetical protein
MVAHGHVPKSKTRASTATSEQTEQHVQQNLSGPAVQLAATDGQQVAMPGLPQELSPIPLDDLIAVACMSPDKQIFRSKILVTFLSFKVSMYSVRS